VEPVAAANQEQTQAWNGPLFDRFSKYRDIVTWGLGSHGDVAMKAFPPPPGGKVLDIGCGFGDTTQRLARLVGPEGEAVGVDVAERFVEAAEAEAAQAGVENVSFSAADVQVADLGEGYDYAFSRMGIMFFDQPVQALRNIGSALAPGGCLCASVWRRKLDNDWVYRAELVVEKYLEHPEESDEPTCGPGPFSMANADTVTEQLVIAGFEDISLGRCDIPIKIGDDIDQAIEFAMALGPAGEVLRLWGDRASEIHPRISADLREALAEFERPEGVIAPASTWTVAARKPAG